MVDGGTEDKNKEHHDHNGIAKALVEQDDWLHAANEHQGQETGQTGPDNLNTNPSVKDPEEYANQVHPQRSQWFHRRQLPESEHDAQTDHRMQIVGWRGETLGGGLFSNHNEFLFEKSLHRPERRMVLRSFSTGRRMTVRTPCAAPRVLSAGRCPRPVCEKNIM